MRQLRKGFECLETRTPPASLLGVLADFFGQDEAPLLADLGQSQSDDLPTSLRGDEEAAIVLVSHAKGDPAAALATAKPEKAAVKDTLDVRPFVEGVEGTSTMIRNANGVTVRLQATGLEPGAPYTLAAVVFNDPSSCTGPCGFADFLAGEGDSFQTTIAERVANPNGKANFAGHMSQDNEGPLKDPTDSEIHVIIYQGSPEDLSFVGVAVHGRDA